MKNTLDKEIRKYENVRTFNNKYILSEEIEVRASKIYLFFFFQEMHEGDPVLREIWP